MSHDFKVHREWRGELEEVKQREDETSEEGSKKRGFDTPSQTRLKKE